MTRQLDGSHKYRKPRAFVIVSYVFQRQKPMFIRQKKNHSNKPMSVLEEKWIIRYTTVIKGSLFVLIIRTTSRIFKFVLLKTNSAIQPCFLSFSSSLPHIKLWKGCCLNTPSVTSLFQFARLSPWCWLSGPPAYLHHVNTPRGKSDLSINERSEKREWNWKESRGEGGWRGFFLEQRRWKEAQEEVRPQGCIRAKAICTLRSIKVTGSPDGSPKAFRKSMALQDLTGKNL